MRSVTFAPSFKEWKRSSMKQVDTLNIQNRKACIWYFYNLL